MPRLEPLGEDAALVRFDGTIEEASASARAMASALRGARLREVIEVSAGARATLIQLRGEPSLRLMDLIRGESLSKPSSSRRSFEIPARYDGEDLRDVAAQLGCSIGELIQLHSQATYTVAFIGFSPGFPYLLGTPQQLQSIRRREQPRPRVPRGSIAVAGGWSAIYPSATPGGWNLIATTELAMFDPEVLPPSTLQPGDRVRFAAT